MDDFISVKLDDSNYVRTFSQLRKCDAFQDVTLVTDDRKQISAHKVVLSACSGYFDNIFRRNPHSHPLLCLDGVNFLHLKNIINFIYDGVVQINHDDYEKFMGFAKKFELEGLNITNISEGIEIIQEANNEEIIVNSEQNYNEKFPLGWEISSGKYEILTHTSNNKKENEKLQINEKNDEILTETKQNFDLSLEIMDTKDSRSGNKILDTPKNNKEKKDNLHRKEFEHDYNVPKKYFNSYNKMSLESSDFSSIEELDLHIQQKILQTSTGGQQCKVCQKVMATPNQMKYHVETHLQGVAFRCDVCGKKSRSRNTLRQHIYKHK